ncbi:MAG: hypothetical protein WC375_09055, partial [Methanomassiliicoccales archaeon]
MKTRNGFVSNSSSSSFVVVFPKKPTSRADVLKIMYPNEQKNVSKFHSILPTHTIAEIVWDDLHYCLKSGKRGKMKRSVSAKSIRDKFGTQYDFVNAKW